MTRYFFADNTVLINFSLIGRPDILDWFVRNCGAWCETVCQEWSRSANKLNLENSWEEILSDPLRPDRAERVDASAIAESMRKPGESQLSKNAGEAETLAIILRRKLDAVIMTDDKEATRVACKERIPVASTARILVSAELTGKITRDQVTEYISLLDSRNQGIGVFPLVEGYVNLFEIHERAYKKQAK